MKHTTYLTYITYLDTKSCCHLEGCSLSEGLLGGRVVLMNMVPFVGNLKQDPTLEKPQVLRYFKSYVAINRTVILRHEEDRKKNKDAAPA